MSQAESQSAPPSPPATGRASTASQSTWRGTSLHRSDSASTGPSSVANFRFSYFPAPPSVIPEASERSTPSPSAWPGADAGSFKPPSRPVSLRVSPTHSFTSHSPFDSHYNSNHTTSNTSNPALNSASDGASVRSSVRSDITIEDLRARTSVYSELVSLSPVLSRAASPSSTNTSPLESDLFFDPARAMAASPTSASGKRRPRPPPLAMSRDRGPPIGPPPLSPLPQPPAPATPTNATPVRQLHRFSGVSGVYEFTMSAGANGSTSTLNANSGEPTTATGTGSVGHEHAVVTRASLLPVLNTSSSSVVPMAVAPATYRDASAALDLRQSRVGNTTPASTGDREELYRGTFVMSEQSLAFNSPMPSTVALSVPPAPDHDELPLPDLPPPLTRSRPLSMQRPPSVATIRSAGAQFAASIRRFAWGRRRPGTAASATGQTSAHPDRDLALPDLAMRAEMLGDMLAEGRLPHDSVTDLPLTASKAARAAAGHGHPTGGRSSSLGGMRSRYGKLPQDVPPGPRSAPLRRPKTPKRVTLAISSTFAGVASRVNPFSDPPDHHRRNASVPESEKRYLVVPRRRCVRWIIVVFASTLVVVSILLGVLLTIHRDGGGDASLCSGNMTGTLCNMDATCVCTSTDSCLPLAQAIAWTIPALNRNFGLDINETDVALTMFDLTGVRVGNCAPQANLIDVAPGLDGIQFPNRTLFAQTALLWSLYASQDLGAVAKMRLFVASANFTTLEKDSPVIDSSDKFVIQTLGYSFDFAAMTATALPTSFEEDAKPDAQQLAAISETDRKVLDRIYLNAKASSSQRSVALSKYWTTELQLPESSVSQFIAAMKTSPVLLPFDATFAAASADMTDLFTSADSLSVPPPAGCYPRATAADLQAIANFERQAFEIDATNASSTQWDSSCMAARPVYGVLNPLRWRTPFFNTSSHPGQALSLQQPAKYRAAFHLGDMLSSFPFEHPRTDLTLDFTDPRDFGTVEHLHHILLSYLQAMPTLKLAAEAAQFIIDVSTAPNSAPPPSSSPLHDASAQLPVIGVAFFGSLTASDVAFFYSDFSSPDGSLFFGSDVGSRFRRWALDDVSAPIAWAADSLAPQFVKDAEQDDTFDKVWDAAAQLVKDGSTGPGSGALETVIQMFNRALYFES